MHRWFCDVENKSISSPNTEKCTVVLDTSGYRTERSPLHLNLLVLFVDRCVFTVSTVIINPRGAFHLKSLFRHLLSCDRASVESRLYKIGQGLPVYSELQCLCVGALLRQSAAGMIM